MKLIGVISDTHGLLREEIEHIFSGVDLIIHAGDIGKEQVIEGLQQIAPVIAVRGNCDREPWAVKYPDTADMIIEDVSIYVLHDIKMLKLNPYESGFKIVISGHSHRPKEEYKNGVLFLNPGSAGPKRFNLPIGVALLQLQDMKIEIKFSDLI